VPQCSAGEHVLRCIACKRIKIADNLPHQRTQTHLRIVLQAVVFAAYLNASVSTVQKWENGEKKPSGAALQKPPRALQ